MGSPSRTPLVSDRRSGPKGRTSANTNFSNCSCDMFRSVTPSSSLSIGGPRTVRQFSAPGTGMTHYPIPGDKGDSKLSQKPSMSAAGIPVLRRCPSSHSCRFKPSVKIRSARSAGSDREYNRQRHLWRFRCAGSRQRVVGQRLSILTPAVPPRCYSAASIGPLHRNNSCWPERQGRTAI